MHMKQVWKILHLSIHVGYAALQNIYKKETLSKIKSKNTTIEIIFEKAQANLLLMVKNTALTLCTL